MKHKKLRLIFLIIFLSSIGIAQNNEEKIDSIKRIVKKVELERELLLSEIKGIRLNIIQKDLLENGMPAIKEGEEIIHHSALSLSYNEKHEQANWVAHIITPDIKGKGFSRTNDFREDTAVKTGSSCEKDFFLKYLQADSTYKYDGFGYDRGHLAPSADFRWCKEAMSESYYYSNMSPQRPEFNREIWAKLESFIREYVAESDEKVYVVTGGILKDDLKKIERGVNKVSIPEEFYKVVLDIDGDSKAGIAFIIPNEKCEYPVISYAVSIDEVEKKTGIDFFPALSDDIENKLESNFDVKHWQTENRKKNLAPINRNKLPKNAINTVQARSYFDSKAKVCGTVVGVHETKSGNIFLNFDQDFPEQLFWCTIWKDNIVNFSYNPEEYLLNKKICIKGTVKKKYGKPSMSLYNDNQITLYDEEMAKKRK
ncbi:MAG: DNA/RNA non-specific endonuclease [Bacteroidales bacterium]|nr:DNA/RNA non-specific endonuclease [Bacteroidales bacterium]